MEKGVELEIWAGAAGRKELPPTSQLLRAPDPTLEPQGVRGLSPKLTGVRVSL